MKTLDEVIKAHEFCVNSAITGAVCEECPAFAKPDCGIRDDALHYLKHLQEYYNMAREHHEPNPALSWDELKQMEGKPVWVEADDGKYKKWFIVGKFFSWFEKEDFDAHVNLYHSCGAMEMSKETYGSYWQAYRKGRE